MQSTHTDRKSLTDLIFEGRNKKYGAYVLRTTHHVTMLRALAIVCCSVGTLSAIALALRADEIIVPPETSNIFDSLISVVYTLPEPKKPEPPVRSAQKPSSSMASSTPSFIISNNQQEEKGLLNAGQSHQVDQGSGTGTEAPAAAIPSGADSSVVNNLFEIDQEPEFDGGLKALTRFIAGHLRYPNEAREALASGTVHMRFVVDETGGVTNVEALNHPGYGFEAEAIRVIKLIPDFKSPGKIKGRPVKVYYTIPVRFTLQ